MKIEIPQSELIIAVEYYFNQVKFKDPIKVTSVQEQGQKNAVLHVEVHAEMVADPEK